MRKIKFRAKGQTDNKWHYGLLVYLDEEVCHIKEDELHTYICDSNTASQYINLKDFNGQEIYEGDILKYDYSISLVRFGNIGYDSNFNGLTGFGLAQWETTDFRGNTFMELWYDFNYNFTDVIGNIYDNPELLEVKK